MTHLRFTLGCGLLGLLGLVALAPVARADNVDRELLRQAPKIMQFLKDNGYKNVGVLTFRMQRGEETPTFRGTLINSNMADRLEQALILAIDPERPINVISQARKAAVAKIRDANYRTASDRKQLFDVRYELPLEQANKYVAADAFLTGKVWVKPDYSLVTIAIEAFDKRRPERFERVLSFDVETDRFMLADLGRGFSLSQRGLKFARGAHDPDIIDSVQDEIRAVERNEPKSPSDSPEAFPVKLTIRYDSVPQSLARDPFAGSTSYTVVDPQEGQRVEFDLQNITDERLGVVLTVNGINTLYEQLGSADAMTRWILEPHKLYRVKGFYQKDKKTFFPIVGLSDEESKATVSDLGEAVGLIHLYVFREQTIKQDDFALANASRGGSLKPVARTGGRPPRSWAEMQKHIVAGMALKGGRGLMWKGDDIEEEELSTSKLGAVHNTNVMTIRYYSVLDN